MKCRSAMFCAIFAVSLTTVMSERASALDLAPDATRVTVEFRREGAATAEAAAEAMARACATESPAHFVQHLSLGVCDGPIDTLQKFAVCLHSTRFRHGENSFVVYDLPRPIDREKPIRAIASQEFDLENEQVAALEMEAVSTYYGEAFQCVDVALESYDGREYRTRIVVALMQGKWYAIPRCRSSKSFYAIADAMPHPPVDAS